MVVGLLFFVMSPRIEAREAEQIVFLLQYIGSDYGVAVHEGQIIHEGEYQEVLNFAGIARERYVATFGSRAETETVEGLEELRRRIDERQPWERVRALVSQLVDALVEQGGLQTTPGQSPDLAHGRELYASDCAPCHGTTGDGEGWAAVSQDPPPTSFRDPMRMSVVSPHQIHGAIKFGIEGTSMPSYEGAYTSAERWSLAHFVASLAGPSVVTTPPASSAGTGLAAVLELEQAFARVAEAVSPAVVGVWVYTPDPVDSAAKPVAPGSWQEADALVRSYPGYRRTRTGSGFFVSEDGYLITCAHLLSEDAALPPDMIIEVETRSNLRFRAHLVGLEPSVNLALLKTEAPVRMQPVELEDSDAGRVGQWAIALGDPPGVERTFAPGTISARPERDCYQASRSSTLFQTSIRIGPESYCGPLVNIHGRTVAMAVPASDFTIGSGTVYGLPSNLVRTLYGALKQTASRHSPWLGIAVLNIDRGLRQRVGRLPSAGVYIEDVFTPSPASAAGVRVGDVLVAMDGNRLFAVQDFQRWLYLLGIGRTIRLELVRDGQALERTVTIEQRPSGAVPR